MLAVDEALALKVLQQRDRILGHRRLHLAAGLRRTELWAQQHAAYVDWVKPDAGALCCVRLKKSRFDNQAVERFHAALGEAGVRVASGVWFGEEPCVLRLGFGLLTIDELDAALRVVSAAFQQAATP